MYNDKKYYYDLVRWYFDEEVSLESLSSILKCPSEDIKDQYVELRRQVKEILNHCYKTRTHIQKAAFEIKTLLLTEGVI